MQTNKQLQSSETVEKQALLNSLLVVRRALNILIADVIESNAETVKKQEIKTHYLYLLKSLL